MKHFVAGVCIAFLISTVRCQAATVCVIGQPTAFASQGVALSVVHTDSTRASFRWTVTGGHVQERNHQVRWLTGGLKAGQYTATATDISSQSRCSVRLFIVEPTRGRRAAAHSLLVRGRGEERGYGLYSYLLFGSAPNENDRQRYLEAVRAYLRLSASLEDLEKLIDHQQLNVNYIPIDMAPLGNPTAEWILQHYDYARATVILHALTTGPSLRGPYVLSGKLQDGNDSVSSLIIFQDLSAVPPELIGKWYEQFLNEAAQEDLSSGDRAQEVVLRMRTLIAVAAAGIPEVQKSLESCLKWIGK